MAVREQIYAPAALPAGEKQIRYPIKWIKVFLQGELKKRLEVFQS
jgi:hypothetical protein